MFWPDHGYLVHVVDPGKNGGCKVRSPLKGYTSAVGFWFLLLLQITITYGTIQEYTKPGSYLRVILGRTSQRTWRSYSNSFSNGEGVLLMRRSDLN